ncbi:MAG TPA: hypothetical protein VF329_13565 [Gammaproteobacteria bacterium]
MATVGFLLGAVIVIVVLSAAVSGVLLRRLQAPQKHLISVGVAWVIASVLGAYGMADGGPPAFAESALSHGIAAIIVWLVMLLKLRLKGRAAPTDSLPPSE